MNCFEVKEQDLAGRIGRLRTAHGAIETPYLFPVIDPLLRNQYVSLEEILNMGFNAIITNAYILKKYRDIDDDIHNLLKFSNIIMTDSGAYQILRYGDIEVSNIDIVSYQCRIKSDIGVILDIPTRYDADREEAFRSAQETLRRAIEVEEVIQNCRETLWVLPIQGGIHLDILKVAAEKAVEIIGYGYSIFALGSPTTLLESYMFNKLVDMIYTVRSSIPSSYPLHLFGAGHPIIIPLAVALGVDLMDSASYILYAEDLRYMTRKITYRLEELKYFPCECPICSRYSPEELMKMPRNDKIRMLALHNLYTIAREIRETKQAIREGRLWEYLEERANSHPTIKKAFNNMKKYLEYIYRRTPINRSSIKAVFILSVDSIYNPKLLLSRRRVLDHMPRSVNCVVLLPYNIGMNYEKNRLHIFEDNDESNCDVYLYKPIVGLIPYNLLSRYPFSQHEIGIEFSRDIINDLIYFTLEVLAKYIDLNHGVFNLRVYICSKNRWTMNFASELYQTLKYLISKDKYVSIDVIDICKHDTL